MRILLATSMLLLATGCAPAIPLPSEPGSFSPPGRSSQARLDKPAGSGPFPAVVLLHSCAGVKSSPSLFDWASRLTAEGYVALVVDSNEPRGVTNNCIPIPGRPSAVSVADVAADAFAALAHLRRLPFVDGDRVGVMGFSYGAMAALRTASASYARGGRFRAAVAFYPQCTGDHPIPYVRENLNNLYNDIVTPLLILMGELDDETPPSTCVPMAEKLRKAGKPVAWKVYPGTTHAFDVAAFGLQPFISHAGIRGTFVYKYNPEATEDAAREVRALFARHLKPPSP